MSNINYMAFSPDEVKDGLMQDLIDCLIKLNSKSTNSFNEIKISTDGYCTIVEWVNNLYEDAEGHFTYVECDELVFKEVYFPDGHYEYIQKSDEAIKEAEEEFMKENPEYYKDEFGIWQEKIE